MFDELLIRISALPAWRKLLAAILTFLSLQLLVTGGQLGLSVILAAGAVLTVGRRPRT